MPPTTRRDVLRAAGTVTSAGALGALAGCTGSGGGGDGGDGASTATPDDGATAEPEPTGTETETAAEGGGSESVTIRFFSGLAAESSLTKEHFQDRLGDFESREGNVTVDLVAMSYGDISQKLSSVVQSDPPDLAESGSAGIQYFLNDEVVDHGAYIEADADLPDNWTAATHEAAKFRGEWWATGQNRHNVTLLTVRPKLFKEVGVSDPSEIATWTGFRRAVEAIDEQFPDTIAYEETGVFNDLESYWGQARTAYTDGADPWIRGDPDDPEVLIGNEPRTDGMIRNCVDMARTYSSEESAQRADEEIPPLLLTDRVASMTSGIGTIQRWRAVTDDVEFGWDGDVWMGPDPRLDPNYGAEFGIPELEGLEGQHGGHAWALLMQKQVFQASDNPDLAWKLARYTNVNEEFVLPLVGDVYTAIPSYQPYMDRVLEEYDVVQIHEAQIEAMVDYGPQYSPTGAAWDIDATDQVRWTAINETISQAIAGQHSIEDTPGVIRQRVMDAIGG
jgi:ABC-type glycerol-3-phosphate transport system substrate-binding protein